MENSKNLVLDQTEDCLMMGFEGEELISYKLKSVNTDKLFRLAYFYNMKKTKESYDFFMKEFSNVTKLPDISSRESSSSIEKSVLRKFNENSLLFDSMLSDNSKEFLKRLNNPEQLKAYKNFLIKLYCNPIQSLRNTIFDAVVKYKLPITSEGYLVCARQVVKVKDASLSQDTSIYDFICSEYFKVKTKWKKSPSKYVMNLQEKKLLPIAEATSSTIPLQQAYEEKDKYVSVKGVYTDNHSKTMRWSVGDVCQIKRNLTRTQLTCGSEMLHIRTNPKELSGHGDTNILVLVSPLDIVSAKEINYKIGVCRFYFAAILETTEIPSVFSEELKVIDLKFKELDFKSQDSYKAVYKGNFDEKSYNDLVSNKVEKWF